MRTVGFFSTIFCLVGLIGCTGLQTFSNAARTGDTVVVAMGKSEGAKFIAARDVTATLVDFTGGRHDVRVSFTARAFPDPLATAAVSPIDPFNYPTYQGQWFALVDLVNPETGIAPALAEGEATLELTHSEVDFDIYDPVIEILPGQGTPHDLMALESSYSPLRAGLMLSTGPHIGVAWEVTGTYDGRPPFGGTFVVNYDSAVFQNPGKVRALKLSQDPNIQLLSSSRDLGNGMWELKVTLLNPYGFSAQAGDDLISGRRSVARDLSFVIQWGQLSNVGTRLSIPNDLMLVSGDYIDQNGDPIDYLTAVFSEGTGYTLD